MKIDKKIENGKASYALVGRLDSNAVSDLKRELDADMDSINYLTLDFSKLEYVSSAGLRLLMNMQRDMNRKGSMKVINVSDEVRNVLKVTGFLNILNIQKS